MQGPGRANPRGHSPWWGSGRTMLQHQGYLAATLANPVPDEVKDSTVRAVRLPGQKTCSALGWRRVQGGWRLGHGLMDHRG